MPRYSVTFLPQNVTVSVPGESTVLEAARGHDFYVNAPCGGRGLCGGCLVRLIGGEASPPDDEERGHIGPERLALGFRLACRLRVRSDMTVRLLHTGEIPRAKTALIGSENHSVEPEGAPRKLLFRPVEPTLHNIAIPLQEALLAALPPEQASRPVPLTIARAFADTVGPGLEAVTLLIDRDRPAGVEPGDTTGRLLGAAVDIGTTTLALYLCDLTTGEILAGSGKANSQAAYGDDVMSRISFCFEKPEGLEILSGLIRRDLCELAQKACGKIGLSTDFIYRWSLVGNTTMQHLFFGFDPVLLGRSPYLPLINGAVEFGPGELGLSGSRFARGLFLPTVAGHVGADTVAVALATRLDEAGGVTLAVDLGTNGEIVLADRGRMICCSTAAGPAFEGARIHMGMRAESGALDSFSVDQEGEPRFHVIGDRPHPRGICGSGLLDIVSELRRVGVIDTTGRILPPGELPAHAPSQVTERLGADERGQGFFLLDEYRDSGGSCRVILHQKDVRELQLAAGAISSGIKILLKLAGREPEQVDRVLLTGAFGNYLDPRSAVGVGLIRDIPLDRLHSIGNAAGVGARFALVSSVEVSRACRIAARMEFVELAATPDWEETFTDSMFFPEL